MNGELKDFVLRKQDEHTKNLALFKTFERIRYPRLFTAQP